MNRKPRSGQKIDPQFNILPRFFTIWICTLCLVLILSGCSENGAEQAGKGKPAAKPLPVKVASVVIKDMPVELRAVGSAPPAA